MTHATFITYRHCGKPSETSSKKNMRTSRRDHSEPSVPLMLSAACSAHTNKLYTQSASLANHLADKTKKYYDSIMQTKVMALTAPQTTNAQQIAKELRAIHETMKPRLTRYQEAASDSQGTNATAPKSAAMPSLFDGVKRPSIAPSKNQLALYPCAEVNDALNRLVGATLLFLSKAQVDMVLAQIEDILPDLRNISTLAEQCMEASALASLFEAIEAEFALCPDTKNTEEHSVIWEAIKSRIDAIAKQQVSGQAPTNTDKIKALLADFCRDYTPHTGTPKAWHEPFKYFDNYVEIVSSAQQGMPIRQQHMQDKTFGFLGAGELPLTAIVRHAQTGCKITLVDIRPEAIERNQYLLKILDKLSLVNYDCFTFRVGDAASFYYCAQPSQRQELSTTSEVQLREIKPREALKIDYLQLASALPGEVKSYIANECLSSDVQHIGVRCVSDLSIVLYEPSEDSALEKRFSLTAKVMTPQHVWPSIAEFRLDECVNPLPELAGISAPINVNDEKFYTARNR